jgi:hypothetical protein
VFVVTPLPPPHHPPPTEIRYNRLLVLVPS